jgi:hypothetical protein
MHERARGVGKRRRKERRTAAPDAVGCQVKHGEHRGVTVSRHGLAATATAAIATADTDAADSTAPTLTGVRSKGRRRREPMLDESRKELRPAGSRCTRKVAEPRRAHAAPGKVNVAHAAAGRGCECGLCIYIYILKNIDVSICEFFYYKNSGLKPWLWVGGKGQSMGARGEKNKKIKRKKNQSRTPAARGYIFRRPRPRAPPPAQRRGALRAP